jgi:SAM-dependent methyltransferase
MRSEVSDRPNDDQPRSRFAEPRDPKKVFVPEYYQHLHDTSKAYRTNNWLLPHVPTLLAAHPRSVLEIGCGNGRATRELALGVEQVYALDWAKSPALEGLPANVSYLQADVRAAVFPEVDMIVSADVLEHFPPADLELLIAKLACGARHGFHVIACYDDAHSHLALAAPQTWLDLFRRSEPGYRLACVDERRGDPQKLVCIISNL